jgi:L-arabinose isomerase
VLYRRQVKYSIVSGHWQDLRCREFLKCELNAVKAANAAGNIHVLELGGKFKGMGDFEYDPDMLERVWGVKSSSIDPEKFIADSAALPENEVAMEIAADSDKFMISDTLTRSVFSDAVRRKIVLRRMLKEKKANAFTMNFSSLYHIRNFGQLPFYAINTLMAEGMGYAGEGDVMRAALMRQCYELCGDANFTEIYTVDFARNLMLMSHMQECNINIAGGKEKRKLFHKEFWMENISGYPGMFFTSEPGDYTVVSITPTPGENNMRLISFEGTVPELPVLDKYDVP